jgi:hypothetical protein
VVAASLMVGSLLAADDPPQNQNPASSTARPATDPAPVGSPIGPVPVGPAPVGPAPVGPAPVDPAPVDPAPVDPAPVGPATTPSSSAVQPGTVESSLYDSLLMAGKTQDQFHPFTPKERLNVYVKDFISPFHFFFAGAQAGITQWQDTPHEWGQGASGYGLRYGNYYGYETISDVLQMFGEDILHEDNYYYGSGYHGFWKRTKYALKSSVLARGADGTQHFSFSQLGSTAGAAFISRIWQPRSTGSAGDGAVSFGIAMGTNAGINVAREFMPDVVRHIFRRGQGSHP